MPRLNADITIYPADSKSDVLEFPASSYDYLSLINDETYGIPPLVTKTGENPPVAGVGDTVLYVNPGAILAMLVEKK